MKLSTFSRTKSLKINGLSQIWFLCISLYLVRFTRINMFETEKSVLLTPFLKTDYNTLYQMSLKSVTVCLTLEIKCAY